MQAICEGIYPDSQARDSGLLEDRHQHPYDNIGLHVPIYRVRLHHCTRNIRVDSNFARNLLKQLNIALYFG